MLCSITQCAVRLGGKGYLKTEWRGSGSLL
nr:MAG TPA: hypothetical protein [Caudoviricetes sp.]